MTPPIQTTDRKALFLAACRGEPVERVPVWMMRQAGRYLPEYRALRAKHSFLEVCRTPDLAAEVSLQPYRIVGVDAVIMFSDILIPAGAMGVPFELTDKGPVIQSSIRNAAQVEKLAIFDPELETGFVMETIRRINRELGTGVPVLGFAAAPWTLACYMIEGRGKEGFPSAKTMLYSEPDLFRKLMGRIAAATAGYLRAQIAAGAAAVQLFDTWAGELTLDQYCEFALPATRFIIEQIAADSSAPVILFSKASNHLIPALADSGANVLSVDWRADLAALRLQFGTSVALQGNVDPCVLLGPEEGVIQAAREAIEQTGGRGHILNLGHGILPQTPVENARAFVRAGQTAPIEQNAPERNVGKTLP